MTNERRRHPFLEGPGPIAFAHRGGAAEAPENTMEAFERAVALGFKYLELDVRASADGQVVVFHDATLDRVCDRTGTVGELPWSELSEARVDDVAPLCRLEDVLGTWPEVRINIDPKCDAVTEPLVEVLRKTGSLDRVCVMAFSDLRLRRIRKLAGPQVCTALGPESQVRLGLAAKGLPVGDLVGDIAQVPADVGPLRPIHQRFIDVAHERGLDVHVWVVDHPGEMRRLLDHGADGIMTDRPSVLRDVLIERGEWGTP